MIELLSNHLFNKFSIVIQRVEYLTVTQCRLTVCDLETGKYFELFVRYDMSLETINELVKEKRL